jgi:L-fuculose-phosphate aldolase
MKNELNHIQRKEEVAYFMRRLYQKNLTTTSGGNISLKLDDGIVLLTPSGVDKGTIKGNQVCILSPNGKNLTRNIRPTVEKNMHLAIYEARPDITAIIHAHPTLATSFTVMDKKINTNLIAESRAVLGDVARTEYVMQGTDELANIVAKATTRANVVLMNNHGVLTVGNDLLQAFDRIEVLEAAAKITIITDMLKSRREIPTESLKLLDNWI